MSEYTPEQIIVLNTDRRARLEFIEQLRQLKEVAAINPDQVENCIGHMIDQLNY